MSVNNQLKFDEKISSEMDEIEKLRELGTARRKSPLRPLKVKKTSAALEIVPTHAYKPQIDPRIRNDKTFQEFYSKVERENAEKVKTFIHNKRANRIIMKQKRIRNFNKLAQSWKEVDKEAEEKKMKNYERMQKKHKKLLEYLRKRQSALEKKKAGILSGKSFLKNNKKFQAYQREKKKIEEQIKDERRAFDWDEIKEREQRIMGEEDEKEEERRKERREFQRKMKKNVENLDKNYFKNQKALSRVKSLDAKFRGKYTDPLSRAYKQKKYGKKVSRYHKPSMSQELSKMTDINKNKAHFGFNLMMKRRQKGIKNIEEAKTYLPYSRKVGKSQTFKKNLGKSTSVSDLNRRGLNDVERLLDDEETSLFFTQKERYNLGRSYLMELRGINKAIMSTSQLDNDEMSELEIDRKFIQYKIQNRTLKNDDDFTQDKVKKIESEINYLEKMAKRQNQKIRNNHNYGLDAIKMEEEADNLLIKSMLAKCVLNDCKIEGKVVKEFKAPDKQYPRPPSPIDYKKARYRLVKKGDKRRNRQGQTKRKQQNKPVYDSDVGNNDGYGGGNEKGMNTDGSDPYGMNEFDDYNNKVETQRENDLFDVDPFDREF